jgi:ATP-dependent Lon protease
MWGAGRLAYEELSSRRRIRLVAFQPMQVGKIDIGMFKEQRSSFSTSEWRALLIRSMGNSPDYYSPASQDILLQRLIPFVQPRVNLMELAPKGTGKSFVYVNLSRYCWVVSGGIITPASLFYNNATRAAGLLTRFDTVVLDEGQSIRFPDPAEMAGPLKVYLEAGEFTRGNTRATADASFVILANIETRFDKPARRDYIRDLAGIFDESAVLDRFHGIIPGWQVPRFSRQAIAHGMGLKADFIGEVFRELRNDVEFMAYIRDRIEVSGDQRDATAVERIATALLKLYFPDLRVNAQEFEQVCLVPAIAMRQRIREQLSEIDPGSFRDRPMAKFSIRPSGFST